MKAVVWLFNLLQQGVPIKSNIKVQGRRKTLLIYIEHERLKSAETNEVRSQKQPQRGENTGRWMPSSCYASHRSAEVSTKSHSVGFLFF